MTWHRTRIRPEPGFDHGTRLGVSEMDTLLSHAFRAVSNSKAIVLSWCTERD